jgi:hypothetical protein
MVTMHLSTIEMLEKYAKGEIELDVAEYGEYVLAGRGHSSFYLAQAIVRLHSHPDRGRMWSRFLRSIERTYGPGWRRWSVIDTRRPLICKRRGCTELALDGICDQCLTRSV